MTLSIGPAGLGPTKTSCETLEQYHKLGFRACELAFTHSIYIKKEEDAERIGKKARSLGVVLSIHAPYYINLNSEDDSKREASKARILECCRVGELLGAHTVVFHPGYYGKNKESSYEVIKNQIIDMMKEIEKNRWNITISAETMGRVNVFGGLDEVKKLVDETGCGFCIDFAHILAREGSVDYKKLVKIFPQKKWHTHFSGIVYGDKGEKNHRTTTKEEWKKLLENLPKDKEITLVNESPTMLEDCAEGLKIARGLGFYSN